MGGWVDGWMGGWVDGWMARMPKATAPKAAESPAMAGWVGV